MYRPGKRLSVAYDILRLPRVPRPLRAVIFAIAVPLLAPYLITPFYAVVEPVSTVMLWREFTGQRMQRQYMPLSRISPALMLAVIVAEDGRFCTHYGVDFAEIRDAVADADGLDDMRGGSTITQQVQRTCFCGRGGTGCARCWNSRWRFGSIWCSRNGASWKFISISPNGVRTANLAPRPAAVMPLVNRCAICRIIRRRSWPRRCPIRMIAIPMRQGPVCAASQAFTSPVPRGRHLPQPVSAPPSLGPVHPL